MGCLILAQSYHLLWDTYYLIKTIIIQTIGMHEAILSIIVNIELMLVPWTNKSKK